MLIKILPLLVNRDLNFRALRSSAAGGLFSEDECLHFLIDFSLNARRDQVH